MFTVKFYTNDETNHGLEMFVIHNEIKLVQK